MISNRTLSFLARAICVPLLLGALVSCGGSDPVDNVAVVVVPSAGVGPVGGTVTGANHAQAIVPAGALPDFVDIAITQPATTLPAFPPTGFIAAGVVYEFTPHGATFAVPVTVRVPFDATLLPAGTAPKLLQAQIGGTFVEVPGTTVDGSFLVASVSSFSLFGPGYTPPSTLAFSEITRQCARESLSGNVYCWGDKGIVAMGSGLTEPAPNATVFREPTRLPEKALTHVVSGNDWACGVNFEGVWCIGAAYVTREVAFTTPPLRQWVKKTLPAGVVLTNLVAGGNYACGLGAANSTPDTVGQAYCWGDNTVGTLGRNVFTTSNTTDAFTILPVNTAHRYAAIAASGSFTCAARVGTGEVECWGSNWYGGVAPYALGNFDYSDTPVARGLSVDPRQGALVGGGVNACGLKADGTAWCWGDNFYGQMGNGASSVYGANYRAPSEVPGIKFKSITPGQTMCGIALDNSTYCWGTASQGSLGNGTAQTPDGKQTTPVLVSVPVGLTFAELAQSGDAVCARTTFNEVYCWGNNRYFQLGIGTNDPVLSTAPIQIKSTNLLRQLP